jgi:methionyl aminopeptidase
MEQQILDRLLKAGKIAAQVRDEGLKKISPGLSCLELMDYCEKRILELGGQIAWAQMAINDTAAHYCPTDDDPTTLKKGDLVKIDIGVHIDGYLADTAATKEVATNNHQDLIQAAQNALQSAIKISIPGTPLWKLGQAQLSEAEEFGFTTVKNLCGHSLGCYQVHSGISIPTYDNQNKTTLTEDQTIAIEPFVTDGKGLIKEKGPATIFMITKPGSARTPYARKILEIVKPLNGFPFTTRWLTRKMSKTSFSLGIKELISLGIATPYPPLVEVSGGLVAQAEHSLIIKPKPIIYTKIN